MEPPKVKIKNAINILGHVHSQGVDQDINELIRPLRKLGIQVNCVLTAGARVSDIKRLAEAELNVLRCENHARRTGELLQKKFGMPYVNIGHSPNSIGLTSQWIREMADALNLRAEAEKVIAEEEANAHRLLEPVKQYTRGKKAAVFLSPGKTFAIAKCLYEDLEMEPVFLCLLHYNEWVIDRIREGVAGWKVKPLVMVEPEYTEIYKALRDLGVEIALGGTVEKLICRQVGIPYVHEMIYEEPHKGYLGVVKLGYEIAEALRGSGGKGGN